MSCLLTFVGSIGSTGVDPAAYSKFVEYTTDTLLPVDNDLSRATTNFFGGLVGGTILSVILLVFFVLIIVIVALGVTEKIEYTSALCIIAFVAACLAIYYGIARVYARKTTSDIALSLQQNFRRSVLLLVNSILRDVIYLSLCA